jgi:hypothetical protein
MLEVNNVVRFAAKLAIQRIVASVAIPQTAPLGRTLRIGLRRLVVPLPIADIVLRAETLHCRQVGEIVQAAMDELISTLGADRWREDDGPTGSK